MRRLSGVNNDMRLVLSNIVPSRVAVTALLCTVGGTLSVTAAPAVSKPTAKPGPKPTTTTKATIKPAAKPATKPAPQPAKPPEAATANAAGLTVQEEKIAGTLVKFKMVHVPGGKVIMPSPKEPGAMQEVEVKPFWIEQHETVWDEFDVFMFKLDLTDEQGAKIDGKTRPSLPYGAPDRGFGHEGFAAISLAHHSGEAYCEWLSKKSGKKYRLPTEAEWEYACRAGAEATKMSSEDVQKVAWVKENSDEKTHPVGEKAPNAWGLYDMLGNAGEWVTGYDGDWVLKGGSFVTPADKVSSMWRAKQEVSWHDPNKPKSKWWLADGPFAGFRIVCED